MRRTWSKVSASHGRLSIHRYVLLTNFSDSLWEGMEIETLWSSWRHTLCQTSQKKKKPTKSSGSVFMIAPREAELGSAEMCTFISWNASSWAPCFLSTTLKNALWPTKKQQKKKPTSNQRSQCASEVRGWKEAGAETVWNFHFIIKIQGLQKKEVSQ